MLESTALGVRHNIEPFRAAGGQIDRVVAVGGGTQGDLWTQIVSDVTGAEQVIPTQTIGASYGPSNPGPQPRAGSASARALAQNARPSHPRYQLLKEPGNVMTFAGRTTLVRVAT